MSKCTERSCPFPSHGGLCDYHLAIFTLSDSLLGSSVDISDIVEGDGATEHLNMTAIRTSSVFKASSFAKNPRTRFIFDYNGKRQYDLDGLPYEKARKSIPVVKFEI